MKSLGGGKIFEFKSCLWGVQKRMQSVHTKRIRIAYIVLFCNYMLCGGGKLLQGIHAKAGKDKNTVRLTNLWAIQIIHMYIYGLHYIYIHTYITMICYKQLNHQIQSRLLSYLSHCQVNNIDWLYDHGAFVAPNQLVILVWLGLGRLHLILYLDHHHHHYHRRVNEDVVIVLFLQHLLVAAINGAIGKRSSSWSRSFQLEKREQIGVRYWTNSMQSGEVKKRGH